MRTGREQIKVSALSYFFALILGLLIIAPNIPYRIPLIVNTFHWCYLVVACGFLGLAVMRTQISIHLRLLSIFLFVSCFFSQVPYLSFNAYVLVAAALWFFILVKRCSFSVILKSIEAAFWLELILACLQLFGMDRLLNFGSAFILDANGNPVATTLVNLHQPVVMGTVMQYMRFASVLAVLSPFLLQISMWYLIPLGFLCLISQSSSFAMSLIAGVAVYCLLSLKARRARLIVIFFSILAVFGYAVYDFGSFQGAIDPANGGRLISWLVVLKTWCMDTSRSIDVTALHLSGPINWQWLFMGHGMDTFLPLFPVYKHDINPFPQAHNDWLQFLWEIGLIGTGYIFNYCVQLFLKIRKRPDLIAGCVCIAVNMFFAFPTRMTQTMFLIVAWLAYCEAETT